MQDNIFKNLREYYQPTVLFQAHVDLILEPIHELHKLYYDNVLESKQFIYQKGYELAELEVLNKIQEHVSMKSDTSPIFHPEDLSSLLEKDQLFGTSKSAAAKLEKDTFNASQKTLTRVDKDINNILVDSYQEGVGYKEVGRRLTKKFNQLKTFEAERIARTETHSAHELGTMQAFEDLDVEYLQWDAHLDNRVRETHEEINGEIIPLGGTFSNGLKYPGDKNGPIKEWINCRCHGVPYILPPGAIAPNMPYFRESDLIIVEKYTPLNFENKLDNSHTLNVSESELQEFIINGEKISYDDIKPFMIKNWEKTVEYDKKYEKLLDSANKKDLKHGTHLEDESDYKFLKSNALTKTKNRVTKYFSKSSTPKEHDKFKLTSSQERNYKKLSIRKESLGFLDKRKLEKLENQVKFNTLHNKKLASNLSYEENKQYKQLYNQFRKEFNLPELKSSERNIFNDLLNRESKRTQNKFEKHLEKLKNTKEFKTDGKTFINFAKDSDDKIIIQVNLQNLNKKQKEILNKWSADIDIYLKDWCHKSTNPNYLEKYVSKKITYEECDKLGKELTNLIESLSTEQTLQENTILWRGIGMKDERMDLSNFVVGEKRKFGEFTSTSFDLDTAESFAMYTDDDEFAGYILKIHAPKGTKGGAIDGERIGNAGTEYEYLLSKNQEYITLNVDENLRIIDILLVN